MITGGRGLVLSLVFSLILDLTHSSLSYMHPLPTFWAKCPSEHGGSEKMLYTKLKKDATWIFVVASNPRHPVIFSDDDWDIQSSPQDSI